MSSKIMWIFVLFHRVDVSPHWAARNGGLEFCQGQRVTFRGDFYTPIWQVRDPPTDSQFRSSLQREPPKPHPLDAAGNDEPGSSAPAVQVIPRHG